MIRDVEFYHGAVLARLCRRGSSPVSIAPYGVGRSSYLIDNQIGLYVKYSTNRLSPWSFSFSEDHQNEVQTLICDFDAAFVALVCGTDGIACLSQAELRRVLDDDFRQMEWVKAARRSREKYSITGSDGRKIFKVADNEFPDKIFVGA